MDRALERLRFSKGPGPINRALELLRFSKGPGPINRALELLRFSDVGGITRGKSVNTRG
jgi:hypothetical protein